MELSCVNFGIKTLSSVCFSSRWWGFGTEIKLLLVNDQQRLLSREHPNSSPGLLVAGTVVLSMFLSFLNISFASMPSSGWWLCFPSDILFAGLLCNVRYTWILLFFFNLAKKSRDFFSLHIPYLVFLVSCMCFIIFILLLESLTAGEKLHTFLLSGQKRTGTLSVLTWRPFTCNNELNTYFCMSGAKHRTLHTVSFNLYNKAAI